MKYELEKVYEVWDERGECLEIGPDRDGLNLIEIRARDADNEITNRMVLEQDQAKLIIAALACSIRDMYDNSFVP